MDKNQRQKTKFNLTLLVHIVSVHAVWWCNQKKKTEDEEEGGGEKKPPAKNIQKF